MPRQRIRVEIEGLLAVHAVRAVRTALGGVPGVAWAEVSMKGVVLETTAPVEEAVLAEALAVAGVRLVSLQVERAGLPML